MKILFVYQNVQYTKLPQMGICMVAAIAKELGHEIDLYDLNTIPPKTEFEVFQKKIDEFSPEVIALSWRSNEWSFIKNHLKKRIQLNNENYILDK